MNKKLVIISIFVLLIIGGIAGWFSFNKTSFNRTIKTSLESQKSSLSKNLPSQNLKEYLSDSGFSFSYPEELTLDNKKASDSATYADISLTSPKVPGQITLKIADTGLKSLEDWSKKGKEITLAGIPAWEISSQDGGLSTAALDQGILFQIEVLPDKEEDYWSSVYKTLIETFSFSPPDVGESSNVESSGDAGGEIIFEGEETIE